MRKMSNTKLSISIVVLLFSILFTSTISATSLGVSPATISLEGRPGTTVEKVLTVSTSDEEPLSVRVSAEGELIDWITFEPKSLLSVSKSDPLKLKIKFKIPRFTAKRTYEDIITISTLPSENSGSGTGSAISTGVAVRTSLKVSSSATMTSDVTKSSPESETSDQRVEKGISIFLIIATIALGLLLFWIRKKKNAVY